MIAHVRTLHHDEDTVFNVVRSHERKLAELIHAQMQSHLWTKDTGFEVQITQGVTTLRENNYTRPAGEAPVNFRAPVDEKQYIRSILFAGSASDCIRCRNSTRTRNGASRSSSSKSRRLRSGSSPQRASSKSTTVTSVRISSTNRISRRKRMAKSCFANRSGRTK